MSHELLYTSAPKGLKSGSRGFCTVVCTQGMPAPLLTALESMSAYRHVYPAGDRNAAKNPIAWSHVTMNVAGRPYRVLSRIADYGLDYSQRGNKLAHHVAIEAQEQTIGNPAFVMQQPDNLETGWDGQPRLLPAGRHLLAGSQPPNMCAAWQALTGDAGWAGVLAESFLTNPERQVYIVFAPGMDLLPLFAEAIALLPVEQRGDVTFSTYFTSLPPGVTCGWRCVLSGSPEAEQSRKFAKALHIDLCQPVPAATGGSLVAAARTGRAATSSPTSPPQFANVDADRPEDDLGAEVELRPVEPDGPALSDGAPGVAFMEYVPTPAGQAGYGVARPPGMPPPPPPMPDRKRRTLADLNAEEAMRPKWVRRVVVSLACLLLALVLGVFAVPKSRDWALKQMGRLRPSANTVAQNEEAPEREQKARSQATTKEVDREQQDERRKDADTVKSSKSTPEQQAEVDEKEVSRKPSETPAVAGVVNPEIKEPAAPPDKTSPAIAMPQFADKYLKVDGSTDEYELFSISVKDAVDNKQPLRVPIRAEKSDWKLYAPAGQSSIKCRAAADEKKEITLSKEQGTGLIQPAVLTVQKSQNGNDWNYQFVKPVQGWEVSRWCLLSVRTPGEKLRLFALQESDLKWKPLSFEGFACILPLDQQDGAKSLPKIRVSSAGIRLDHSDEPLQFKPEPGAGDGEPLTCEIPDAFAKTILFGEQDRKLKLGVVPKEAQITIKILPNGKERTIVKALNDIFDKGMKTRLDNIVRQYTQVSESRGLSINLVKLGNEFLAARLENRAREELSKWNLAVTTELKAIPAQINTAQSGLDLNKQQQIDQHKQRQNGLTQTESNLKSLEDSVTDFLAFRDGLKTAKLVQLSLHYTFEVFIQNNESDRAVQRQVPIDLEFRDPSR